MTSDGQVLDRSANPLIRKLEATDGFTGRDRERLERLCLGPRALAARKDIIQYGDPPDSVNLVLDGLAIRYKLLPEGKRQIVAVLLPGDFCDLHVAILGQMDHFIATLTPCSIANITAADVRDLTDNYPRIIHGLWWATLVDEAVLREWLANLGQRDALARVAHFFCEMLLRLRAVDLAEEAGFAFPFTQGDLADIFGLTSIHVNRTLQELRARGLIVLERRHLRIVDEKRLMAFCAFDPLYLHQNPRPPSGAI